MQFGVLMMQLFDLKPNPASLTYIKFMQDCFLNLLHGQPTQSPAIDNSHMG